MPKETEPNPIKFPKGTEILHNLADIDGGRISEKLVRHILETPSLKFVFFLGPPGAGKSTVREQLALALTENSSIPLQIEYVSFDDALDEVVQELQAEKAILEKDQHLFNIMHRDLLRRKVDTLDKSRWMQPQWDYVSYKLTRRIQEHYQSCKDEYPEKRILVLVETPAIGFNNTGKSTVIQAAIRNDPEKPEAPESLFIFVHYDIRVLEFAGKFRQEMIEAKTIDQIMHVMAENGIALPKGMSAKDYQKIVIMSAPLRFILLVQEKILNLSQALILDIGRILNMKPDEFFSLLFRLIDEPRFTEKMRQTDKADWTLTALFMYYSLQEFTQEKPITYIRSQKNQRQLDHAFGYVVHNILLRKEIFKKIGKEIVSDKTL